MEKISIIHEPKIDEPFLILNKPKHLPSAPLFEGDESAYSQAEKMYPELKFVNGKKEVEHGLVHRIDNETDGLLLIAANQEFYDWIVKCQSDGQFKKNYTAICHVDSDSRDESFPRSPFWGIPVFKPVKINSRFRFYGPKNALVRPVTEESSRIIQKKSSSVIYTTTIDSVEKSDGNVKVVCSIDRGFKHQVRCHLAWCGLSVFGDKKYCKKNDDCELMFSATGLSFPMPNGKIFSIHI